MTQIADFVLVFALPGCRLYIAARARYCLTTVLVDRGMFWLTVVLLTVGDSGESPLVSGVLVDRGLTYCQLTAVRVR